MQYGVRHPGLPRAGHPGALLVAGSSLTVYSGFRFVRRAAEPGTPVAILNLGPTRGDPLARLKIDALAGRVLPALAAAIAR